MLPYVFISSFWFGHCFCLMCCFQTVHRLTITSLIFSPSVPIFHVIARCPCAKPVHTHCHVISKCGFVKQHSPYSRYMAVSTKNLWKNAVLGNWWILTRSATAQRICLGSVFKLILYTNIVVAWYCITTSFWKY